MPLRLHPLATGSWPRLQLGRHGLRQSLLSCHRKQSHQKYCLDTIGGRTHKAERARRKAENSFSVASVSSSYDEGAPSEYVSRTIASQLAERYRTTILASLYSNLV